MAKVSEKLTSGIPKAEVPYKHPPFFRDLPIPKFLVRAFPTPASRLVVGGLLAAGAAMYSTQSKKIERLEQQLKTVKGVQGSILVEVGHLSSNDRRWSLGSVAPARRGGWSWWW